MDVYIILFLIYCTCFFLFGECDIIIITWGYLTIINILKCFTFLVVFQYNCSATCTMISFIFTCRCRTYFWPIVWRSNACEHEQLVWYVGRATHCTLVTNHLYVIYDPSLSLEKNIKCHICLTWSYLKHFHTFVIRLSHMFRTCLEARGSLRRNIKTRYVAYHSLYIWV